MVPTVDPTHGLVQVRNFQPPQFRRSRPLRLQLYSIIAVNRRRPPRRFPCQPFRTKNSPLVAAICRVHLSVVLLSLIRKIPRPFRLPLWEQHPLLHRCISRHCNSKKPLSAQLTITRLRVRSWSLKKWKQFLSVTSQ